MNAAEDFRDWIGSRHSVEDDVTRASVAGMSATLDRDDPGPVDGDPLPPLWHWMYFAPRERQSTLGPDGHPLRGGFMPPVPLPRRMFAGGRLTFHAPLRVGRRLRRDGEVMRVAPKEGRSGTLVFVTVRYRVSDGDTLLLEEENDIVYRDLDTGAARDANRAAPEPAALDGMDWRREITADPVMLFRYSALTFNGHRIHYDQPYATQVEGYPGLIVHGPLIATLLAELARDETGGRVMASFAFRAHRPLFDIAPFTLAGRMTPDDKGCALVAVDPDGMAAMTAEVVFAES